MHEPVVVQATHLQHLLDTLKDRGYLVVGPTVRDGAIVYASIDTVSDLPAGWTDEQERGHYQLVQRNDQAWFGYAVGPHSWKQFLYPPQLRLWQAQRQENGFHFIENTQEVPRYAFLGVRACELHAIAIQEILLRRETSSAGRGSFRPTAGILMPKPWNSRAPSPLMARACTLNAMRITTWATR